MGPTRGQSYKTKFNGSLEDLGSETYIYWRLDHGCVQLLIDNITDYESDQYSWLCQINTKQVKKISFLGKQHTLYYGYYY